LRNVLTVQISRSGIMISIYIYGRRFTTLRTGRRDLLLKMLRTDLKRGHG